MNAAAKAESVRFSTRGRVTIPAPHSRIPKSEFRISKARAHLEITPDGILIRPVTAVTIHRLRGILKRKPGEKPFAKQMAEHKKREKELEDHK